MEILKQNMLKIFLVLIVVFIIIILVLSIVPKQYNTVEERTLANAARNYYNDKSDLLPKDNYATSVITMEELIQGNYIKPEKRRDGSTNTCDSYVIVVKSGDEYFYNPYIKCNDDRDTILLYDAITNNVVEDNDEGLHKINDEYIFKGESPDNFVSFAGTTWRIVKIDEDKNIKIIYSGRTVRSFAWDDRYNLETNRNSGINDYSVSRIYTYLQEYLYDSDNFSANNRADLALVDLCINKRSSSDTSTDGSTECAKKLKNQMIGLLQANEYFNASTDKNCSPNTQAVCQNYNFLASRQYWSITATNENTWGVYRIQPSVGLDMRNARDRNNVLPVVHLRNSTVITGGTGTSENPYVIR